jgi:hypothetical protein
LERVLVSDKAGLRDISRLPPAEEDIAINSLKECTHIRDRLNFDSFSEGSPNSAFNYTVLRIGN